MGEDLKILYLIFPLPIFGCIFLAQTQRFPNPHVYEIFPRFAQALHSEGYAKASCPLHHEGLGHLYGNGYFRHWCAQEPFFVDTGTM